MRERLARLRVRTDEEGKPEQSTRRQPGRLGWVLLGVATLWVLLFSLPERHFLPARWFTGRQGATPTGVLHSPAKRKPMPPLAFEQLDGGTWRLADRRGKVVLINLWATWCGPCRAEMGDLERLSMLDGPGGLEVVGVAMDGLGGPANRSKVKVFADRLGVNYPVVLPPPMSQIEAGLEGLPTTILVDRSGRLFQTYVGALGEPGFEQDVRGLLQEQ